jgi:hypothetical protein
MEQRLEKFRANLDLLLKHQRTMILMSERQSQRAIGNGMDWKKFASSLESCDLELTCDCAKSSHGCGSCRYLERGQVDVASSFANLGSIAEEMVQYYITMECHGIYSLATYRMESWKI